MHFQQLQRNQMYVFTFRLLHMKYVELQDKNFGILHDTIGPTYKK